MVTIKDIARRANVTDATVSRILNNKAEKHSAKTIEKVWGIAREMGYVVNAMARVTKTGRSKVLGVIAGSLSIGLRRGLSRAADERGFLIKSFFATEEETISEYVDRMTTIVLSQRIDGVIIHCANEGICALTERLAAAGIPCVVTSVIGEGNENMSCFRSDDESGGAIVADYFLRLGHGDFACVGDENKNLVETLRVRGFIDHLERNGGRIKPERVITTPNALKRVEETRRVFSELAGKPLAVFCASSNETINVLTACLSMKLNVPDDVSIAGYCGYEFAHTVTPALTTVDECGFERGFEACSHLIDMIEGKTGPTSRTFPVKLTERKSCAPFGGRR